MVVVCQLVLMVDGVGCVMVCAKGFVLSSPIDCRMCLHS